MSASQQHGFEIEKIILDNMGKKSRLTKKVPLSHSHVSRFDASGYNDPAAKGIPTSIKTAKRSASGNALICMADATRIGELAQVPQMRLLVALYDQKGNQKVFNEVREYIITNKEWRKAIGGVPADVLKMFNEEIKVDDPDEARVIAKDWKDSLAAEYPSVMRWNPKIDSKNQRRVQCSIYLKDLEALIQVPQRIQVFGAVPGAVSNRLWGTGTPFPIAIVSPPRPRNTKPKKVAQKSVNVGKKPQKRA